VTTLRRAILGVAIALLLVAAAPTLPAGAQQEDPTPSTEGTPTTLPEELGNIIGSPDPGPEPEDAGDRGGWAQLALLGVLVAVVALVLRHLFRSANRNEPPTPA